MPTLARTTDQAWEPLEFTTVTRALRRNSKLKVKFLTHNSMKRWQKKRGEKAYKTLTSGKKDSLGINKRRAANAPGKVAYRKRAAKSVINQALKSKKRVY